VALLAVGVLTACTDDPPTAAEGPRLVESSEPDEHTGLVREGDRTVRPGELYSFTSRMVCLTEPGVVRITGAEFDPASNGLEIVDVRVRRPVWDGWGSLKGPLDRLPFVANPGNEVRTVCRRFGGTDDPPMDETGVTVRRTTETPGTASKIRFRYSVDGREEKTDWFDSYWTLGAPGKG
jgi:hypothetical protein